ncbi:MAG: hypothetical protein GEU79_19505 [Acidimicrobiia bacterium]|nr:hypothetical protein [Acidimicrobiia bacterium]
MTEEELADNRIESFPDIKAHPLCDQWHQDRTIDLDRITVPFLSAANWGGQGIHPRGNFNGFVHADSENKWLEAHGDTHWTHFYSAYGRDLQKRFFDHFLKGPPTAGDTPVDALVLNAGMVLPDVTGRTVDGFETTFAVNHLAHYLLLRLLLTALADQAIVVLTTSGTHDPANNAVLAPPRHADAELLAHPDRDTRVPKAGEHAYTASRLCTVLTA